MRHGKGISRNKPSTYQRANRVVRAAVKDDQYVCACATIWMREAGCVTSFSLIGDITRRMRFEKWRRGKASRNNGPLNSGLLFGAPRWPLLSATSCHGIVNSGCGAVSHNSMELYLGIRYALAYAAPPGLLVSYIRLLPMRQSFSFNYWTSYFAIKRTSAQSLQMSTREFIAMPGY